MHIIEIIFLIVCVLVLLYIAAVIWVNWKSYKSSAPKKSPYPYLNSGTYLYRGLVVARQPLATSEKFSDSARWDIEALVTWDATSGSLKIEEINGSPENVGTDLMPTKSFGKGVDWRLPFSVDNIKNKLIWEVKGEGTKTILYANNIHRMAARQE